MRTLGWYVVRLELATAIAVPVAAFLLMLFRPNTMGPPHDPFDYWTTPVGALGIAVGLVLMVRIHRSDPERAPSSWRAIRR